MNSYCNSLLLLQLILLRVCGHGVMAHGDHEKMKDKLQNLKDKFDIVNVMRDPQHLIEDLKLVAELNDKQVLTLEESYFYMIRISDYDNNDGLDGNELLTAFRLLEDHYDNGKSKNRTLDDHCETVDFLMQHDMNNDGFLTYAEFTIAGKQHEEHTEH